MHDIFELMKSRCSCRNFTDEPIPAELLDRLLTASVSGPSSGGFQNYSIIKVTEPEEKAQLAQCCRGQSFIGKAAVNLVYCIDLHRERRISDAMHAVPDTSLDYQKLILLTIDAAVAAQNFCVAAEENGIGTVYIGNVLNQQKDVAELLRLPEMVVPVIMVTAGWPGAKGVVSGKYPVSVMVHDGYYEEKDIEVLKEAFDAKYDGWKMKPNDKLMEKIGQTAAAYKGEEYRRANRETLLDSSYVDPLSFWYGYYYAGAEGAMSQEDHKRFLESQGLSFLK